MITIDKDNYYHAMWHTSGNFVSLMIMVWEDPEGNVHGMGRVRFIEDDKIHDSDDRKEWLKLDDGLDLETALDHTRQAVELFEKMAEEFGDPQDTDYVELDMSGEDMIQWIQDSPPPWMHVQELDEDEAKEYLDGEQSG